MAHYDPHLSSGLSPTNLSVVDMNYTTVAPIVDTRKVALLKQTLPVVVALSIAYIIVFVLAVVNNSLVVSVIIRNPQMRNVTNYFLANLAVADILVSFIVLPITLLSNIFHKWWYGYLACKAVPYLQAVAVSAAVNTQALVALERYFAIFYPQKTIIRPDRALVIIGVIWFLPMCIQTPWAIFSKYEVFHFADSTETMVICYPKFNSQEFERGFFLGVVFLTCYIAPLGFITICYSMIGLKVWKRNVSGIRGSKTERNIQLSKIRIVRMLVTVAVVFALFWLPLYSLRLYVLYGPELSSHGKRMVRIMLPIVQWLGSANSCVNPFIYCYFSEQFKRSILYIFQNRSCCGRIVPTQSSNAKTKSTVV